ncbi:MAG TPA: alpha-2-macroglobulin family protein [Geobacteraceae bacterium]|nr:alpha-2-macroglobulin family protein [Geobacteraceae bacterium]
MANFRWFFLSFLFFTFFSSTPLFAAFDSAKFNSQQGAIQVIGISPTGTDVPAGREIVIHFNRPVVPVGRMERTSAEVPVTIDPPLACDWRWLNTSSLACQLSEKEAMTPATTYTVRIRPGLKAEDSTVMKKELTHTFSTERPKVTEYSFTAWHSAVHPQIQVNFNQPVNMKSVEAHLYFRMANGRRVALLALEDSEHKKKRKKKAATDVQKPPNDGHFWFVEPKEELPPDSGIDLMVEPGVIPLKGKNPGAEERVIVGFATFPQFSFLGVRCKNNMNREITLRPGQAPGLGELCNPLDEVSLLFSAPVLNSEIRDHVRFTPDLAGGRKDYNPWENAGDWSRLTEPHKPGKEYANWLPEILRADRSYSISIPEGKLRDEFGRPLAGAVKMAFATDHRKPYYVFDHHYSVLEKGVDSELPIVVTNLAQLNVNYAAMSGKGKQTRGEELLTVGPALDIAYPMPLKVREMLKVPSGVLAGEIFTAPPLPDKTAEDRWFMTQITPFNVQVKVGHFNTLVWVTDFATGLPVKGVAIDIFKGKPRELPAKVKTLHRAVSDENGIALLPGAEKLDPGLKLLGYGRADNPRLIVRCMKGEDIALVPLLDDFSAYYYGSEEDYIEAYLQQIYAHIHTWGTTAQGIYKVGDTVQFKLYVRNQDNRTFVAPPLKGYSLQVIDPMGKVAYEVKKVALSEFGAYDGEFTLPKNSAVGWYRFVLKASFRKGEWEPMQVLVSDFTPAPFRVTTELGGKLFRSGDTVKVSTVARLHAGGPYARAGARITAQLRPEQFTSDDPKARGFTFDTVTPDAKGPQKIMQKEAELNASGELADQFLVNGTDVLYGRIDVESAVRDDRGKYVANSASASFVGRDRYVGLSQPDWLMKAGEPARVRAIVVDDQGKTTAGAEIRLLVEYKKTVASRVKGAGNAYLTHFEDAWEKVAETTVVSAGDAVEYTFTPAHPGIHRITATITDSKGREHSTRLERWCAGKGQMIWESEANNSLKVVPEKKEYKVGETARFAVQNPFPGARALVTIERYGVMKSWVETFSDNSPVVEYKVEPDAVPGFHLSVIVVSPRVEKPLGPNQVDLGKPAFRMGYVAVPVKDPYKELTIKITPEKKEYRPRATVAVDLQAYPAQGDGKVPRPPMELAVAVLDEAVFDLIKKGRNYFDIYKGFYYLDPLDIRNFNILMQLVGRQKFEKKGANAGGDGGPDLSMRSTFKFVAYWNPSLKTDADGKARVEFQVPDNLTGWRVLAMAVTTGDRMGLGEGEFKVTTPIEIRPVMPNQLIEGDRVEAGFTIMNRTDRERTLNVSIGAKGPIESGGRESVAVNEKITTKPFARNIVRLPLKATGSGRITITARAFDKDEGDSVEHILPVLKRQSLQAAATYGTTTEKSVTERIAIPSAIRTDVGQVSVTAAPTVIGNLESAFGYMREYPYDCWEQKLSKGVMAAHYRRLKDYLPKEFAWPESKDLPQATLKLAAEYQAPNGGISFYLPMDTFASPYLSAYTALAFNWLARDGYKVPPQVEKKLHGYLLDILRNNTMPSFYSRGMASTVRAVALAALAPHGRVTAADLRRYRGHLPEMSLFGKAHYLLALLQVKGTEDLRREAATLILNQASETGGKYIFSEKLDMDFEQILTSTIRDNAAVLSALAAYGETAEGTKLIRDIPYKLVRTITQTRGNRDRCWENTQENIFAMNALIDYKRIYEREKPDMMVTAMFAGEKLGSASFTGPRDRAGDFGRPLRSDDPGKQGTVTIEKTGKGRLYYNTRLFYAPLELPKRGINAGIEVIREYSVERDGNWVLLASPMQLRVGELVRVDLYLSLKAARNFVVVDDPVPGGLEPVNRDLATASTVDAEKGEMKRPMGSLWFHFGDWIDFGLSWGRFYHKELRHSAARFYSEYLPAGNYHLSYVGQAIAPGEFTVLPTHAEEMYDPDVFGKGAPAMLRVE